MRNGPLLRGLMLAALSLPVAAQAQTVSFTTVDANRDGALSLSELTAAVGSATADQIWAQAAGQTLTRDVMRRIADAARTGDTVNGSDDGPYHDLADDDSGNDSYDDSGNDSYDDDSGNDGYDDSDGRDDDDDHGGGDDDDDHDDDDGDDDDGGDDDHGGGDDDGDED